MKNLGLVVICLFFFGCASFNPSLGIMAFGQKDTRTYQTFEGTKTTESLVIIPIGSALADYDDMGLKIGRITLNGNVIRYCFQAELHTAKWVFANSIAVKIDDKIYHLHDDFPTRQIQDRDYVIEVLTFDITPEMLEELKLATTFGAELYKRVVFLEDKQLQRLKEFLQ
jgi:hypothetical protein